MGRYTGSNEKAIRRGFSRLSAKKDRIIEEGMCNLLRDAMNYAIANHDHGHFGHRINDNSYGWALLHNRSIVRLQVNGGRHGHGDAEDQLQEACKSIGNDGWVGILLASMLLEFNRRKPIYFEVDYEIGILDSTQDNIKDLFARYFKPLAV